MKLSKYQQVIQDYAYWTSRKKVNKKEILKFIQQFDMYDEGTNSCSNTLLEEYTRIYDTYIEWKSEDHSCSTTIREVATEMECSENMEHLFFLWESRKAIAQELGQVRRRICLIGNSLCKDAGLELSHLIKDEKIEYGIPLGNDPF